MTDREKNVFNNKRGSNMSKKIIILLILVAMNFTLYAKKITLEEATEIMLRNNYEYKSIQQGTKQADANKIASLMSYLPSASLNGNYTKFLPDQEMGVQKNSFNSQFGITITQPILNGGRIHYGYKTKNESFKMAKENEKSKKIALISELETSYYSVLEAKRNLSIAINSYRVSQKHLKSGKVKFEANVISKSDLLTFEVDTANKELTLLNASNNYATMMNNFMNMLNIDEDYELVDIDLLESEFLINNYSSMILEHQDEITQALLNYSSEINPSLKLLESKVILNEYAKKISQGSFLPTLSLVYTNNWSNSEIDTDYSDQGTLMLRASLPIFPLANTYYTTKSSSISLAQSKFDLLSMHQKIDTGIDTNVNNYIIACRRVTIANSALTLSQQLFSKKEVQYNSNLLSVDDYLDAQLEVDNARERFISSVYGYKKSEITLRKSVGIENQKELMQIIDNIVMKGE